MSTAVLGGLALTLLAGLLSGNCMLPMKFARRWQWENVWFVYSIVSLVIAPWALAILLVGNLSAIYGGLTVSQFLVPFLCGAGWGIAQVLFGLLIARLGLALTYAIVIGLGSLGGTLIPLFSTNREMIGTPRGALILAGLAVMMVGIAVSALAGRQREQGRKVEASGSYAIALTMAILCGLLAPMINYSFAFGQGIAERAVQLGASPVRAGYAVWPIGLIGGLLPNLAYSTYLLCRKRTWHLFRGPWWPDAGFASLMGLLWMGAMSAYGVASVYLGALGTSVGWGLFQIFMIMTANLGGVLTGEWKDAPRRAKGTLYVGLALLAVATILLAAGNR